MSCVWLPAEILCETLCHTLAEQRAGDLHTSPWLLYHNSKCWVLPVFYFPGFPIPVIVTLCLWHVCLFQQVRGLSNPWCLLLSQGMAGWIPIPGNPVLQPSHPTTLACTAEQFCMQDFSFSWWQEVITVPVSNVRVKVFFCKHDSYLRFSTWQSASCTEFL